MSEPQPDIVLILADDLGFSDLGCYGGEIDTPSLDGLARGGVRMTQFYNTARCSPSRASLLTGLHPHQVGVGILTNDDTPEGYPGNLSEASVTIPEALRAAGYATYMCGKWHLASDAEEPNGAWPTRRGFDRFFGQLHGGNFFHPVDLMRDEKVVAHERLQEDFFYTDAVNDNAVQFIREHQGSRGQQPFFLYLAHSAPHWPLHAHEADIAKYGGRFDRGWEQLRRERLARLAAEGIVDPVSTLSEPDPEVPPWEEVHDREWEARRMEVYAAQVDRMDRGIGRVLDELDRLGRLDNTLVMFLSDNGGSAEELPPELFADGLPDGLRFLTDDVTPDGTPVVFGNHRGLMPGPATTYQSYGRAWANLSNSPFREYKHWVHEGGIATPFLAHWPAGLPERPVVCPCPAQLTDVMPTLLEAACAEYPATRGGQPVPSMEGRSILPAWRGQTVEPRTLFWEHEGNSAVRCGRWKLVRKHGQGWELYDVAVDRAERDDVSAHEPELVVEMATSYEEWATRCGVIPRERILELYARRSNAA